MLRQLRTTSHRTLCHLLGLALAVGLQARQMQVRVVDSQTGLPVARVKVRAWVRTNLVSDANGLFELALPKPESDRFSYRLTLSKEGYVGKYVTWSQSLGDKSDALPTNYTVKLEPGVSIGGMVVDESGSPLIGARVLFSAPPDAAPGREHSVVAPNYHAEHTDPEGHWHNSEVPRDFRLFVFRVDQQDYVPAYFITDREAAGAADNVTLLSPADLLAGTAKMILGHGIELSGQVINSAGKPVPGVTITRNHEWRNSAATLSTDADGKFTMINLRPEEMILTFQAQGLSAQTRRLTLTNRMPPLTVQMPPGRVFRGRILDEDGKPIVNATVQMDRIALGPLEYDWSASTDHDGRFVWDSAPDGAHPYYFSADGFHSLSDPAMVADGQDHIITLRKERNGDQTLFSGFVRDAPSRAPLTNFVVSVTEYRGSLASNVETSVSDVNGHYAVRVDSGDTVCRVVVTASGHLMSDPENRSPDDGDQHIDFDLAPGTIRDVIGKFAVPGAKGPIDWKADHLALLSTVVPPPPITVTDRAAAEQAFEEFLDTDEGAAWQRAHRSYPVLVDSNGVFRIQDVPAGKFELRVNVRQEGELIASLTTQFTIASNSPVDAPVDLGEVGIPLKKVLKVTDTAPDFTIKTVDGEPLRLADYRGKYVLLDFWATWCGPCVGEMPNLKSTYDTFSADTHFAMISLSLDDDPEAPRRFARTHGIKWTQGFLGKWSDDSAAGAFGVEAIPSIFLIDPNGKIIEKNLRGEQIRAAVEKALGSQR